MLEQSIEMLQIATTICKWAAFAGFLISQVMFLIGIVRTLVIQRPDRNYWFSFAIDTIRTSALPAVCYACGKTVLEVLSNGL